MTIGTLYDANNVIVGQAALFVAASGTALPDVSLANLADPFDPAPFMSYSATVAASSSYTLSYGGQATSTLTDTSTAAAIETALAALSTVGTGNVTVTGTGTAYTVLFDEQVAGQTLTATATTGTATLTGGLWTPVGATDQGWKFGTNKNTQDTTIEEQSTPVGQSITTQNVTFQGALSEDISRTLALAWNAYLTKVAAATGKPGYDQLALTDDVLTYAVCLITNHVNGMPRWIYAPKCSQLSQSSTDFRRAAGKRMYPVTFTTLCKPSEIVTLNFTTAGL